MARKANLLTARTVATITEPGLHPDGGNLYLCATGKQGRSWVFIYKWKGKRTEIGLGSLQDVTLACARVKAAGHRQLIASGQNPRRPSSAIRAVDPYPTLSLQVSRWFARIVCRSSSVNRATSTIGGDVFRLAACSGARSLPARKRPSHDVGFKADGGCANDACGTRRLEG